MMIRWFTACGLSLALLGSSACNNKIRVTSVELETPIYDSPSAGANLIYTAALGQRFTADKPASETPDIWNLDTPNGRGVAPGNAMTPYPIAASAYQVKVQVAVVRMEPREDARALLELPHGMKVGMARPPGARLPEGYMAIIDRGNVVGFVNTADLEPAANP